jgi:alpha-ketoglutarate-dependent taurine dioxygenase
VPLRRRKAADLLPQRLLPLLLDLYEEIAGSPEFRIDMELRPGDIQWLSNHSVVHARTAYRDAGTAAGARRHLLRLWLSIE